MREADGQGNALSVRDTVWLFVAAVALRAAALQPGLPPGPPEARLLGSEAGGVLLAARLASVMAGALAVVLLARAGNHLAGRTGGLAAGALLATVPFALRHSGWIGTPGVAVLGVSGALLHLVRWSASRRPADLAAAGAWTALAGVALGWAPLTNVADTGVVSPLLEGLRQLAGVAGPVTAVLALAGAVAALRSSHGPVHAVTWTTGVALLVVLLREGADPHALGIVLPGTILLAAFVVARPGALLRGIPAVAGWAALALALLAAIVGATRTIAARGTTPSTETETWIRKNLPTGSAVLVGDRAVRPPEFDPVSDERGFHPVELPARDAAAGEVGLFYDPRIARHFPWIVVPDPVFGASAARKSFHEYFTGAWEVAARFGEGEYPALPITVFRRPTGWAPSEPSPPSRALAAGDTSQALTAWLIRAGNALRSSGELGGADAILEVARARDIGAAEVWYETGLVRLLEEDWDKAASAFLDALRIDPQHGAAHYNLGTILEREGDRNGAETEYREAVLYLENPAPAHARLGALLAAHGDLDEARAELQLLRRIEPDSQGLRFLERAIAEAELGGS